MGNLLFSYVMFTVNCFKNNTIRLLFVSFLFLSGFSVWSEPIVSIEVEGIKRLRKDVLLKSLPVSVGDEYSEDTKDDISIALAKMNLFSEYRIDTEESAEDGVRVSITVEEKWTLIPLPFLLYTDGSLAGGLFFLESNFLGRRQILVSGFTYIKKEAFGLLTYRNPDIGIYGMGSGFSFVYTDSASGPGSIGFTAGLSKMILPDTEAYVRAGYSLGRESSLLDGGTALTKLSFPLRIKYDATVPVGVLSRGPYTLAEISPGWSVSSGDPALSSRAVVKYGWVPAEKHNIELFGSAGIDAMDFVFQSERGGGMGERTLPRNEILTGAIASADVSYQYVFWSNKAVSLTATGFLEGGMYSRERFRTPDDFIRNGTDLDGYELYYGPGAGMRLYIRKVAVPAMGLDFGYNVTDGDFRFSFSVGMTM